MKKSLSAKKVAIIAVSIALVLVSTVSVRIPNALDGYMNFGDAMIMMISVIFGPLAGALSGAIGSSMADLIGGYFHYVVPTFLIKGLEGFLIGLITKGVYRKLKEKKSNYIKILFANILGATLMFALYFVAKYALFATGIRVDSKNRAPLIIATASILGNVIQGYVSVIIASFIIFSSSLSSRIMQFVINVYDSDYEKLDNGVDIENKEE